MIGIFDSGSGGLSVLFALRERAPKANVVYFGDIDNAPYGTKSQDELARLVRSGIQKLVEHGATEIIVACNSVSSSVLAGAAEGISFIEMSRPTARMMRTHAGKRVLLLATQATIDAGLYRDALWSIVTLDELVVPDLARAIEEEESESVIACIIRTALLSRAGNSYDAILLSCTHYPLVADILTTEARAIFGEAPIFIDPAHAVAEEAFQRFSCNEEGVIHFLISKDSHAFRNRIAPLFFEVQSTLTIV